MFVGTFTCACLWNKRGYVPCSNLVFNSSTFGVKTYQLPPVPTLTGFRKGIQWVTRGKRYLPLCRLSADEGNLSLRGGKHTTWRCYFISTAKLPPRSIRQLHHRQNKLSSHECTWREDERVADIIPDSFSSIIISLSPFELCILSPFEIPGCQNDGIILT